MRSDFPFGMDIGVAQRPCRGERVCGDRVAIVEGGGTLVAVADGLGHGPGAADAAHQFCAYVTRNCHEDVDRILDGASVELRGSRGVAATLLRIHEGARRVSVAGIGNVEVRAAAAQPICPLPVPGIVGRAGRRARCYRYDLAGGELLVLFTDGLSSRLELPGGDPESAQRVADTLLATYGKDHDDATCVAVRIPRAAR